MKTQILLVDHSQQTLDAFQAALAEHAHSWQIDTLTDPQAALVYIAAQAPTVVVANFQLPGTTGLEFLREVESIQPQTQRFILASDEQRSSIVPWLGSACLYLPNPCPTPQLVAEIQRCVSIERWLGNPRIRQLVAKVDTFPTLPTIYLQIVDALNAPEPSPADVAQAIAGDVAIAAKILQLANSAYYGFDEKVTDIKQAVAFIGLQSVKNLVLALKVFGDIGKSDEQREQIAQVLGHSIGVAVAAQRIALLETADERLANEAYTAGLLHDIGKLLLITATPRLYKETRALARERNRPEWEAESDLVGCHHAELGAYILGRWGMPATIVESTARHHEPVDNAAGAFTPLAAVHCANALEWERIPARSSRPEARCSEPFLADIGRADRLDEWRQIIRCTDSELAAHLNRTPKSKTQSPTPAPKPKSFLASALSAIGLK